MAQRRRPASLYVLSYGSTSRGNVASADQRCRSRKWREDACVRTVARARWPSMRHAAEAQRHCALKLIAPGKGPNTSWQSPATAQAMSAIRRYPRNHSSIEASHAMSSFRVARTAKPAMRGRSYFSASFASCSIEPFACRLDAIQRRRPATGPARARRTVPFQQAAGTLRPVAPRAVARTLWRCLCARHQDVRGAGYNGVDGGTCKFLLMLTVARRLRFPWHAPSPRRSSRPAMSLPFLTISNKPRSEQGLPRIPGVAESKLIMRVHGYQMQRIGL